MEDGLVQAGRFASAHRRSALVLSATLALSGIAAVAQASEPPRKGPITITLVETAIDLKARIDLQAEVDAAESLYADATSTLTDTAARNELRTALDAASTILQAGPAVPRTKSPIAVSPSPSIAPAPSADRPSESSTAAALEVPPATHPVVQAAQSVADASASLIQEQNSELLASLSLALDAASVRLSSWEGVALDPTNVEALRATIAQAVAVRDAGVTPNWVPQDVATLTSALTTQTASLPEIVSSPEAPTTIGGVVIVNKTFPLPASYVPGLLPEVDAALHAMAHDAEATAGLSIFVTSGYRSYIDQDVTYSGYAATHGFDVADTFSARPGHSEHQSGLAVDLNLARSAFAGTVEAEWIEANAARFGFIVRYPEGKEGVTGYMYEPWHVRYVGVELATHLSGSGLTLEEYLGVVSGY